MSEERRRLESFRTDYNTILRSRFHALRTLWFSFKAFVGRLGANDRYATWSPSITPAFDSVVPPSYAPSPEERRLVDAWNERYERNPLSTTPIVTVVIPVYNKLEVTVRCLQSIADTWFDSLAVQIVVVDDGSHDGTPQFIPKLRGIDFVRGKNQGFVRACNRGAALATGRYICFLNNDTAVGDAWLDYLVTTAENDRTVGAVGAKLVYPDGTLQEAGGILWRDATGQNYGRDGNPKDSKYNYVRDVDYCSGAALLVRRDLFTKLGGFSETYVPAYYEDADLCFGVRSLGYRVVYNPRAEVIHYEGVTSGTDLSSGIKRYQQINRPKFVEKWHEQLQAHFENDQKNVPLGARRLRHGSTILVVDSHVPLYDKDAGSLRLLQILKMLRDAKFNVVFLPDNYAALQPYTRELQDMGIEVLHHTENALPPLHAALNEVLPILDYAWICRPQLFHKYEPLIRPNSATRLLYDTIDLHFVRKLREIELFGGDATDAEQIERTELEAARNAHATIVVTENERELLQARGISPVYVIPTLHDTEIDRPREYAQSSGLLFIGGYNHAPNADAATWLVNEIMPLVWKSDPTIPVTLLGSNPPEAVLALQSDRVSVPGYIPDVTSYFMQSRLFVAPLRFGAGMKGKVGQALSFGLPSVLTDVAAEGFTVQSGRDCTIANDAPAFAKAILELYEDEARWCSTSAASLEALRPCSSATIRPQLLAMLESVRNRGKITVPV